MKPSNRLNEFIENRRPKKGDKKLPEQKMVQEMLIDEFTRLIPQLPQLDKHISRTNVPRSTYEFNTYEEFMAQPYRGPVGDDWIDPSLAAKDYGTEFNWRPFLVGTLMISDVRLIAIKDDVIAHLEQSVESEPVFVELNGFAGMATTSVFSYSVGAPAKPDEQFIYPLILGYGEKILADVVGNHWRYEFSEESQAYVACSPHQAKRNWLQGKIKNRMGAFVGDEWSLIADHNKLLKLILGTLTSYLSEEEREALAPMLADKPTTEDLRKIAGRDATIQKILSDLGYHDVPGN